MPQDLTDDKSTMVQEMAGLLPSGNNPLHEPILTQNYDVTRLLCVNKTLPLFFFPDIIDSVFEEDDLDQDGYLTYVEFVLARQREEARNKKEDELEKAAGNKH